MKTKFYQITSFLLIFGLFSGTNLHGETGTILVSGSAQSVPVVRIIADDTNLPPGEGEYALLFLPARIPEPEQWQPFDGVEFGPLRSIGVSRGTGGTVADTIPSQTMQLEQLQPFVVDRWHPMICGHNEKTIYSPANNSVLLNPQPTFRRYRIEDT